MGGLVEMTSLLENAVGLLFSPLAPSGHCSSLRLLQRGQMDAQSSSHGSSPYNLLWPGISLACLRILTLTPSKAIDMVFGNCPFAVLPRRKGFKRSTLM